MIVFNFPNILQSKQKSMDPTIQKILHDSTKLTQMIIRILFTIGTVILLTFSIGPLSTKERGYL